MFTYGRTFFKTKTYEIIFSKYFSFRIITKLGVMDLYAIW